MPIASGGLDHRSMHGSTTLTTFWPACLKAKRKKGKGKGKEKQSQSTRTTTVSRSNSTRVSAVTQTDSIKTGREVSQKQRRRDENEQYDECLDAGPSCSQSPLSGPGDEGPSVLGYSTLQLQQIQHPSLSFPRPTSLQIFRLWQVFLTNVHPLVMLFHAPSVQQVILDIATDPMGVNKATEALGLAINLCAIASITDSECLELTGESKADSLERFSQLSSTALFNSDCMHSNSIVALQALTLYTLAIFYMRASPSESEEVVTLAGRAAQMAQALDLHQEERQEDLPAFAREMRRRLFWQILILDGRAAAAQHLRAGATAREPHFPANSWNVQRPLSLSDSQLVPSMSRLPPEQDSPTEMLLCSIRIEIEQAMRRLDQLQQLQQAAVVEQTEQRIEQRLRRSCDACISFHLLTTYQARSWLSQLRLSVYHPRRRGQSLDQQADERERARLFSLAQQILLYDNFIHSNPRFRRYLWLLGRDVPVDAVIIVLTELLSRSKDNNDKEEEEEDGKPGLVGHAWNQITQVYEDHPMLINAAVDNPLFLAINRLALKAWDSRPRRMVFKRERTPSSSSWNDLTEPPCISRLRSQKATLDPISF